jgi:hypothetical protein
VARRRYGLRDSYRLARDAARHAQRTADSASKYDVGRPNFYEIAILAHTRWLWIAGVPHPTAADANDADLYEG